MLLLLLMLFVSLLLLLLFVLLLLLLVLLLFMLVFVLLSLLLVSLWSSDLGNERNNFNIQSKNLFFLFSSLRISICLMSASNSFWRKRIIKSDLEKVFLLLVSFLTNKDILTYLVVRKVIQSFIWISGQSWRIYKENAIKKKEKKTYFVFCEGFDLVFHVFYFDWNFIIFFFDESLNMKIFKLINYQSK